LNQSTVNAWNEITSIYTTSIPQIQGPITTSEAIYTDFILIHSDTKSVVYSATMHTNNNTPQSVIVKAYISINRNSFASNEDKITTLLSSRGLMVPKRYSTFSTEHYNCFPMERLDYTLKDLFTTNPTQAISIPIILSIVRACVPILELLHKETKLLYVDFSCGNVAFRHSSDEMNPLAYMIDFGALHEAIYVTPCMKTMRYCSANAIAEKPVDTVDDLQSLGFVILDAMYGPLNSDCPLNSMLQTESGRLKIVRDSIDGIYGPFIQNYFSLIRINDPYKGLVEMCDIYQ